MVFEQRPRRRSHISEAVAAAASRRLLADLVPFPARPRLGGAPPPPVVLAGAVPDGPLSINRTAGRAYGPTLVHKKLWQELGRSMAADNLAVLEPFRGRRVGVTLALPVARPGQCDAGNYVGGVSVKAWQDGFTRSGVVVPDDTAVWLDTAVVFWRGGPGRDELRVKVQVAPPAEDPACW